MVRLQNPTRVLIVDDEDIIQYGLKTIFQTEAMVKVVGEARNGQEAIAQVKALQPDVVLMDISMPDIDGITVTRDICQMLPQTKVLILTTYDEEQYITDAIQHGAIGYLLKKTPPEDFKDIIRAAHKGYMQLSSSLGQKLCQQLKSPSHQKPPINLQDVTPREQEVINLIAEGASNREIATILHITEKTVKNHVSNILSRIGLRDRTQLAIWVNTLAISTIHPLSA